MATLLLQAVGASLGGVFGGVGAVIGQAAGALAGNIIDNALLTPNRTIEGRRLSNAVPYAADDGAPLARIYGTVRVPGALVWTTRFEEDVTSERQGGKAFGSTTVRSYSYFANAAFALCEGEIAGIRRIWADGQELDQGEFEFRVHRGTRDQQPDPLILAKQGEDNAPAYRDTAYVVFERMALERFGNRIPQLQFEVMRPVGRLERHIRALTLIPGATEFGYAPNPILNEIAPGETVFVNCHARHGISDWAAALDEAQALCPNLEHVALVVSWYGDDLRAGACRIRPGVTSAAAPGLGRVWAAGGVNRATAHVVSTHAGGAAFGGTPDDLSIIEAIRDLKSRGLKVTLYPFVMMDIPAGNALPSPYGGAGGQPVYPWRGRITCTPAEGVAGSVNGSETAAAQVAAFLGAASAADFSITGDVVNFSGTATDWGYRRFILHLAKLAVAAGGVDAFLIGSELPGLTRITGAGGTFPFVSGLMTLAADVRTMLGPATKLTYGADWTEYFGCKPMNAPSEIRYNLDPLWAHPAIDAIGIDWYMPLTDWRDSDLHGGNPDGMVSPHDRDAFLAGVTGGEGAQWHYASDADRQARIRSAITDGAYGKPWVWRVKDVRAWWENQHHDRVDGTEAATPSAWVPRSKPVWLTEIGCPAIDKGANQPNVFGDPKSSESAVPHFSGGGRDDLQQRTYLDVHQHAFDPAFDGFDGASNPAGGLYGGRMIDPARCYVWAFDTRPFPAFPLRGDAWGDGGNWAAGHWLNGRLGGLSLGELAEAILRDHGLTLDHRIEAGGWLAGHAVIRPQSARETLEPLLDAFGASWRVSGGHPDIMTLDAHRGAPVKIDDVVVDDQAGDIVHARSAAVAVPNEILLSYSDPLRGYEAATASAFEPDGSLAHQHALALPVALDEATAAGLAARWLERARGEARSVHFKLPLRWAGLQPGDEFRLADDETLWRVERITHGETLAVEARAGVKRAFRAATLNLPMPAGDDAGATGRAAMLVLDIPGDGREISGPVLKIAAAAHPWRRQAVLERRNGTDRLAGFIEARATIGRLVDAVAPRASWRLVDQAIMVAIARGGLQSISIERLLDGGNLAAMQALTGAWEVFQFQSAEETAPGQWMLHGLLRGQRGTEDAALAGAAAGAAFVLLDDAVASVSLAGGFGEPVTLRAGPAAKPVTDVAWQTLAHDGSLLPALPPSPVHVRAEQSVAGDTEFAWVRRGRIDADDWAAAEIPLGEQEERYGFEIRTPGGSVVRHGSVGTPSFTYTAAQRAADLGAANASFTFVVWQEGRLAGRGRIAQLAVG